MKHCHTTSVSAVLFVGLLIMFLPLAGQTEEVSTSAPVFQQQVEMTVFPNPASDILNVVSPEPMQEVRILDMLGKLVHSARPNSPEVRIDTSGFWPGIYFVQVFTDRAVTTKRVQVTR